MKIIIDTTLEKLFELYTKAAASLLGQGIVCFVSGEPAWGTLRK